MPILLNFGYAFALDPSITPDGGIILAGTVPSHALLRRKFAKWPHLKYRVFDPQLYMAGLDPNLVPDYCTKLASYSWFGIDGIPEYESTQQTQSEWKEQNKSLVQRAWLSKALTARDNPNLVDQAVADCIDMQLRLGCAALILPGPLTADPGTDYSEELYWLDAGLTYVRQHGIGLPTFATVAITDNCLRFFDPQDNSLIDLILDGVGARQSDGVYVVVEQSSEPENARQISHVRVLWSALHMAHVFKNETRKRVMVNHFGPFGMALEAAGADMWGTAWYKSLYRLRLADKIAGGRAFPIFWANGALTDVNMDTDFDEITRQGLLDLVADSTPSSAGLLKAAYAGKSSKSVPPWQYRVSNTTAAANHFMQSVIRAEKDLGALGAPARLDYIEQWLTTGADSASKLASALGKAAKTKTVHAQAWLDAFCKFRRFHNV